MPDRYLTKPMCYNILRSKIGSISQRSCSSAGFGVPKANAPIMEGHDGIVLV